MFSLPLVRGDMRKCKLSFPLPVHGRMSVTVCSLHVRTSRPKCAAAALVRSKGTSEKHTESGTVEPPKCKLHPAISINMFWRIVCRRSPAKGLFRRLGASLFRKRSYTGGVFTRFCGLWFSALFENVGCFEERV